MKIFPLSEGAFSVDQSKKFVSFQVGADDLQQRSKGSLLVEIQPFVVITGRDIIVLDAGLGYSGPEGTLQIHQNLARHGIASGDVTKVLLSHLHKDHSGGIAVTDKTSVSFKNALYYVSSKEWDFAFQKGAPSYQTADFLCLSDNRQLQFTDGTGLIDEYIHFEMTGGHSPFHQVFLIEEGGQKVFFGGDVAPQLQQMKNRFKAKYDFDGARSMELRAKWWQQGAEEKWTFLFYHDIKSPVFQC